MKLYCGTSGFSFKEWKGPFYPEKHPANEMLTYYAERLPTVEINNTFYRMPRKDMLAGWVEKVPKTFRFAIKAPRRITHSKKLAGCEEEIGWLFGALEALGSHLGIVLFQLPPHARMDADVLDAFATLLPEDIPAAFEFRHPSWHDEAVFDVLRKHDKSWVGTDNDGGPPRDIPQTSRTAFFRLRADEYSDARLAEWKAYCEDYDQAFVYFKHEDGGAAPAFAQRMLSL